MRAAIGAITGFDALEQLSMQNVHQFMGGFSWDLAITQDWGPVCLTMYICSDLNSWKTDDFFTGGQSALQCTSVVI